ncbi:MAG: ATP-binding protein [Bacteroidia bacterium]|nr:ATP-binding protein [Bacteroidia bacterium]
MPDGSLKKIGMALLTWLLPVVASFYFSYLSVLSPKKELNQIITGLKALTNDEEMPLKASEKDMWNPMVIELPDNRLTDTTLIKTRINFQLVFQHKQGFFDAPQGIFYFKYQYQKPVHRVFIQKIQSYYPISNQYFRDEVHPALLSAFEPRLNLKKGPHVLNFNGQSIYVKFNREINPQYSLTAWCLWSISILLLLFVTHITNLREFHRGLCYALVSILWFVMYFRWLPASFYDHILFDSGNFFIPGNVFVRHHGDVLALVIFILGLSVSKSFFSASKQNVIKTIRIILNCGLYFLSLWLFNIFSEHNESLIQPDKFSEFDAVSALLVFLLWSCQVITLKNSILSLNHSHKTIQILFMVLMIGIHIFIWSCWGIQIHISIVLTILLLIFLLQAFYHHVGPWILYLSVFSFISMMDAAMIVPHNHLKSKKLMEEFARQKLNERDEAFEGEFSDIPQRLSQEKSIQNLIELAPQEELTELLRKNIFYGYFRKYEIHFSLFDSNCLPEWKTEFIFLRNLDALKELMATRSEPTISGHLRLVSWPDGNKYYLSLLPIKNKTLACLFIPLPVGESGTLLDLFSDMGTSGLLKKASAEFALYRNGIMIENSGLSELPYVLNQNTYDFSEDFVVMSDPKSHQKIIFRLPSNRFLQYFKIFLMLLIIHGIAWSIIFILLQAITERKGIQALKFREKLLLFFISALSMIMAIIFVFISQSIRKDFREQSANHLKEKFRTFKKTVSELFRESDDLNTIKDPLDFQMKKMSFESGTDVVFYDSTGVQMLTTIEKLNDFGVRLPVLWKNITQELKKGSIVIREEWAGNMNYLCLYGPAFVNKNILAGYFALPYFPSRSEVLKRQDGLINNVVNLLIILIPVAIILSMFLSSYIVRPLQILTSRLGSKKALWENDPLQWNSQDEIGTLVDAYNRMLEQLKENISKLSEQERESAWREMARQIAHEIKNPLTPIRLNIQHLMYLHKKSPVQFEEKFENSAEAILQQIDALNAIANEFGNFAKISKEPFEFFSLSDCIASVLELYRSAPGITIQSEVSTDIRVFGNKNQIFSVLNNLFENSREALQSSSDGKIWITFEQKENKLFVKVKDNGPGIPSDIRPKLFTPYFTTKTSGTGLGLAIAKRIMQHHGGDLYLEDNNEPGACFVLVFPVT